jgi:ArsR family transcriptional regulator
MYYRVAGDAEGGRLVRLLLEQLDADDPALAGDLGRMHRVLEVRDARPLTGEGGAAPAVDDELVPLISAELGESGRDTLLYFGHAPDEVLVGLGSRARRAVGMNPSRMVVQRARARLHSAGLNHCLLQRGDLAALPHPSNSFDVAVVDRVLAAEARPVDALREAARVLRPAGRLLLIEDFEALERRAPDSNPLALLRTWLADAGLACDRLRPLDVGAVELEAAAA